MHSLACIKIKRPKKISENIVDLKKPATPPGFRLGGNILWGRPRRGLGGGGGAPRRQKNLKISKKFLKKIAKNGLF